MDKFSKVKLTLERIILGKKGELGQKTRFFVKNVCFETIFGQLTGIQQFILIKTNYKISF